MGRKTRNKNTNGDKTRKVEPTVWVTVITGIVSIVVALLSFPPIIAYFTPHPTLTPSPTFTLIPLFSPTPLSSDTLTPFVTDTFAPSASPSLTNTFTPSASPSLTNTPTLIIIPTDTPPSSRILVSLFADMVTGKSPLAVRFDARSSYLLTPDGTQHPCQTGACHYTWKAYLRGQQPGRPDTDSGGTFHHTFNDKGSYIVTVEVCWGMDRLYCAESSTFIEVTK